MTALTSLFMDDTHAAPTLSAPSEDETQSIHAWSQEDAATEIVEYRPRSWKLPITLAVAAVIGMVGAATYLEWPAPSAQKSQVAPAKPQVAAKPTIVNTPPVQVQSPDQRFIALLQQRGVKVVSPPAALKGAHDVCRLEAEGHDAKAIAEKFTEVTPGADIATEGVFVMTAQEVYCP